MLVPFALLLAAQTVEAPPPPSSSDRDAMIANCNARMVEIPVTITSKGLPKETKVKICGEVGQTDAAWGKTLRDALNKVETNPAMSPSLKNQIISGLRLEIAKLPGGFPLAGTAALIAPAPATSSIVPPPARPVPELGRVEYSSLPPLPAPLPSASAAVVAANLPPPLPAPRLTLRCLSTSSMAGDGPCDAIERGMMVTVRADENLPAGTSLRFLRRGDNRAEVDLAELKRGQSQRFSLPAKVCQGVTGSRVEIQVVRTAPRGPQVVDTRGPFDLRC